MPSKAVLTLKVLRDAVRRRVEQTSIRVVAEEIGMSPSGLHILLRGSRPHPATREKLVRWYVEQRDAQETRGEPVSPVDVDVALQLLMLYVTQDARETVQRRRIREIVRRFEAGVGGSGNESEGEG
jgi:hypothetical protein